MRVAGVGRFPRSVTKRIHSRAFPACLAPRFATQTAAPCFFCNTIFKTWKARPSMAIACKPIAEVQYPEGGAPAGRSFALAACCPLGQHPRHHGAPQAHPATGLRFVGGSVFLVRRVAGQSRLAYLLGKIDRKCWVKRRDVSSLTGCRLTFKNPPCSRE